MKRNLALLVLSALVLVGCKHRIGYKLTEADRWNGPKLNGVLCVQPVVDASVAITNKQERINKETWRLNYRSGYANTNISEAVTATIVKHLAHSGLFKKVTTGSEANADWVLSGRLTDFATRAHANDKAEIIQSVSAGFGLLGAIVGSASTSKMTSDIQTTVKIDPVSLSDRAGQIVWQDSISVTNSKTVDFGQANEYAVFYHPDAALKQAVSEMIQRIASSVTTNSHTSVIR